jgi:hydroxyacylglutathione hydrolase
MIGLDRIAGWFGTSAIDAWADRHGELARIEQVDAGGLAEGLESGGVQLVDVRARSEWEAGHVAGATHIPLNQLQQRLDEVRRDAEVVLQCATGSRSAIAAGILRANGFDSVANHQGGFEQWRREGLPVETGDATVST